jgi:hypothetical protein
MFARILIEGALVLGIITQVIIPLIRGTPLFPAFRRRRQSKLIGELEHAKQDLVEDDIEEQVHQLRDEHTKRHPPVEPVEKTTAKQQDTF